MPCALQGPWVPQTATVAVSGDKVAINVLGRSDRHQCLLAFPGRHDVCTVIAGRVAADTQVGT